MRATTLTLSDHGAQAAFVHAPQSTERFSFVDQPLPPRQFAPFLNELSRATGAEFFQQLVEYMGECLAFEVVVVAELPPAGDGQLRPIATYPSDITSGAVMRALMGTHGASDDANAEASFALPINGSDGRPLGVICGFGPAANVDQETMSLLSSLVAQRAGAAMERQRTSGEMERKQALFIGLAAETQDVVGIVDADGCFTVVSPAIERVLGFCPETCTGYPVVELVHPLDRDSVAALLRISDANGYFVEARLRRTDGTWLTMEVSVAEHHNDDGQPIKVLSARDLTNVRQLEDRLRQSQKTEMIGRLATGIAHDFGNILMVVRSHADVMRLRTTQDDPRHSSVDAIEEAVARGADLARQLLAFTRHREAEMNRVDLNASVEQSAALLRRVVGSSIQLETRLSPEARYVVADATQIEQVILNLTLNARDAMPNGGRIVFETAAAGAVPMPPAVAAAPDDFVCFSVSDCGCGIPEHIQPRIFEPLFTTKMDGAGTGIGLATVNDIVTRHSGFIEVVSREGAGTRFNVFLRRTVVPLPRAS